MKKKNTLNYLSLSLIKNPDIFIFHHNCLAHELKITTITTS